MSRPLSRSRAPVAAITALSFLYAQAIPTLAAGPITRADYEACQARDEPAFRVAIAALTRKSLEAGLANLDYKTLVADEWRKQNLDDVIDRLVDQAVGEVRDESSWTSLLQSLASKERAQELALAVTERVYRSEAMRKSIETMATGVGREIGNRIELATVDTAEPATQCVQAFLSGRYGMTIARVVATGAGREYQLDARKGAASVSTGQILVEGREGIAGTVVLVLRRQLSNMAARIGQRMVGAVLSRLVSVVAGGVGLVLIAKDVWDFRHGVLPIISDEMKSKATKEKVREELARSVSEQLADSLKEISDRTADRVVEIWTEFKSAHAKVIDLAERQPDFKRYLDSVKPEDLARLDEIVGLVLASEGEAAVVRRVVDGSLPRAVTSLPAPALEIARQSRSLETALQWLRLAGDGIARVVDYDISRRAKPEAFTQASLKKLLAIDDRLAVTRIAALGSSAREALLDLPAAEMTKLARALDEPQLESLAGYLTGLGKEPSQRILHAVALSPAHMKLLSKPGVRDAIINSPDQAAAVAFMLEGSTFPRPSQIYDSARLVTDGRIDPLLLWYKDPVSLSALLIGTLALLLLLKRLLFGARPRVVVHQMPARAPLRRRGRDA